MREMLGMSRITVANHCFSMTRASKSRLAKVAGAEVAVELRNEKWHGTVARSTFPSQNVQKTSVRA